MRLGGFRRKLYRLTYDKPAMNRKALQLSRSLEEILRVLEETKPGKIGRK